MKREEKKEFIIEGTGGAYQKDVGGEPIYTEFSEDMVLPEYRPEIRKVLSRSARLVPGGRYIGAAKAEFGYSVVYNIIYCGAEGEPVSVSFSSDGEVMKEIPEEAGPDAAIYESSEIESFSIRPSGPRKLSCKARVKTDISILTESEIGGKKCAKESERLSFTVPSLFVQKGESGEFECSFPLGDIGVSPEGPLSACGTLTVCDITAGEGKVRVFCELLATVIPDFKTGEIKKKYSFAHDIEMHGVTQKHSLSAKGECHTCEVAFDNEESFFNGVCYITVTAMKNRDCIITKDAFIAYKDCDCRYEKKEIPSLAVCKNTMLSVSGERELSADDAASGRIFAVQGEPSLFAPEADGGKLVFRGNIAASAVLADIGGSASDAAQVKTDIPFKYECDIICEGESYSSESSVSIASIAAHREGDRLIFDCELSLSLAVRSMNVVENVEDVTEREGERKAEGAKITVYYPKKGDTLWRIAKRFRMPVRDLAHAASMGDVAFDEIDKTEVEKIVVI